MPLFDMKCEHCRVVFQDVLVRKGDDDLTCDSCGDDLVKLWSPVAVIGATHSKPIVYKQLNRTFETNAEERAYFKAHPDQHVVSRNDSTLAHLHAELRNDNDRVARAHGYHDWDHRQLARRDAKKRAAG